MFYFLLTLSIAALSYWLGVDHTRADAEIEGAAYRDKNGKFTWYGYDKRQADIKQCLNIEDDNAS